MSEDWHDGLYHKRDEVAAQASGLSVTQEVQSLPVGDSSRLSTGMLRRCTMSLIHIRFTSHGKMGNVCQTVVGTRS